MSGSVKSNSSLPLDNDIVKQGYLYIKRPPKNGFLRFKSWHKRYFVLRDETLDHPSRLEMYQKEADFCKNSSRRFCLNLDKVVHVGRTEDSKRFRQAFVIVCSGRTPLMLAEDDHLYTNSWLLAVTLIAEKRHYNNDGMESCMGHFSGPPFAHEFGRTFSGEFHDCLDDASLNICYSDALLEEMTSRRYNVTVEPTKPSYRNGIDGDYDLVVHPWRLLLFRPSKDDVVVQWPICFIRKFKSEYLPHYNRKKCTLVTLELGRRCSTGEGIFQFRTQFGKEIIADINQAIFHSMSHRTVNRSRSSYQGNCTVTSGVWKPLSRDNSSSRGVSLSRQSSGGTSRTSKLMMDGSLQVVDLAGVLQNHNISCSSQRRSPLRSDSSCDSKTLSDNIPQSRASVLSLLSSSSSSHSSHSASSNESAEYIQAGFSSPTPSHSALKDPWKFCVPATTAFEILSNNTPLHDNEHDALNGDITIANDRATKAAAEGYLEVLPDFSSHLTRADSNDFASIYHSMDFSKRASSSPNHSRTCSSAGSSSNRSENDKTTLPSTISSAHESNSDYPNDNVASTRKIKSGSSLRNKPPAPLPRPVHTMS